MIGYDHEDVRFLVDQLQAIGIELAVDPVNHPGMLCVRYPRGFSDSALDAVIDENKSAILSYLCAKPPDAESGVFDNLWPEHDAAADDAGRCRSCGSLEKRQETTGQWKCQRCSPSRSQKLAELAARLRGRIPTRPIDRKAPRQLIGNRYPALSAPLVPEGIIARPAAYCRACGKNRLLAGVPGKNENICWDCWRARRLIVENDLADSPTVRAGSAP